MTCSAATAIIPNVVIFGETGVGKSSLVNMIVGKDVAQVSSRPMGCTFESKSYLVDIDGTCFNIYDTAGLEEGDRGTVAKQDAIVQLYELLCKLESGISLLVFCMRGDLKIRGSCTRNWRLFSEIICQRRVPIILAVTGLEDEEQGMDNWWPQNEESFMKYEMYANGVACITAKKGKRLSDGSYRLEKEYAESQVRIRKAISTLYLRSPWQVPAPEWFKTIIETTYKENLFKSTEEIKNSRIVLGNATRELIKHCEMTEDEAKALGDKLNASM